MMIKNTQKLSNDLVIHQYQGKASNIYILEDNKQKATFLVDCGMPSDARSLIDTLSSMPPLKYIVCTHFHPDHASGWINLKKVFKDCEIWFHEKAKPFVRGHKRIPFPSLGDFTAILIPCLKESGYFPGIGDLLYGGLYGSPFKKGFPGNMVKFFTNEQPVLPGFKTIHTPGHRPESVSFIDPTSGILISGDFLVVINGKVIINTFVASQKDQEDSKIKIKKINGIKFIYPGHGVCRPFSVRDL